MENQSYLKSKLRKELIEKRKAISPERRQEAAFLAKKALENKGTILSFSPIGSEIDLSALNNSLKKKGKLFLVPYKIDALLHVPLEKIDYILVPALGFDQYNTRLGYGKGYYDRFLAKIHGAITIGVGFKEQMTKEPLPKDPWDIPVQELLLF